MKIAVVFATLGRPEIVSTSLNMMAEQSRPPDQIVISAVTPADAPAPAGHPAFKLVLGPVGLPAQRNTGLRAIDPDVDVVVFFDDDFAPERTYLERLETLFAADAAIAGATGCVIADGIGGAGFSFDDARRFLAVHSTRPPRAARVRRVGSLYGCNMAIRVSCAKDLAFDEALPLYAWQEDVDYTTRLGKRGALVWSDALVGVHLGVKRARTPGRPLGYAQIANPIFLRRKRTMTWLHAYTLMARNLTANLVRSVRPEPWCDRRGRLAGNLRALGHLLTGKLHPCKMLELK